MAINFTNRFTAGGNTGLFTTLYGTCDTDAATAAKTVTVDEFVLETQARVTVKFTYANSAASPTLDVNGNGAKKIRWRGAALPSTQYWAANQVIDFVYDGTYWNMIGAANDNNTHYAAGITAGTSETTSNSATSDPYIIIKDNSIYRSQIQLKGSGATTISSDANGVITISSTDNNTDTKVKCTALATVASDTAETLYPVLMCNTSSPTSGASYEAMFNTGVTISNYGVLMGAAWNDYAEYRNQEEEVEPGYCVKSADNGKVSKTTEKYAACDGIVSDTFGFSIGKTDTCRTPLAVAGRVLAYFEGNREDYHAGDTVCAGPNGKVMKMTREEIKEYPDRIIGLVSEIPEYETWGQNNILVNRRIWIKIK